MRPWELRWFRRFATRPMPIARTVTRIERFLIIWPSHIYCWAAPHINRLRAVSSFLRRSND